MKKTNYIGFLVGLSLLLTACIGSMGDRPSNDIEAFYKCRLDASKGSCEKDPLLWLLAFAGGSGGSGVFERTYEDGSSFEITAGQKIILRPRNHVEGSKYTVAPNLPEGLTLDADTGVVEGVVNTALSATQFAITQTQPDGTVVTFTITITIKVNTDGNSTTAGWTKLYGESGKSGDGYDVTTDASGNVYVVGTIEDNTPSAKAFVRKYSSDGSLVWSKEETGTGSRQVYGFSIALDSDNNVVITGYISGGSGDFNGVTPTSGVTSEAYLIKYNNNGDRLWTRLTGGQFGYGVDTDSSGNIYVTGRTGDDVDGQTKTGIADMFAMKYNAAGTRQWTELVGTASQSTYGHAISVSPDGTVYVSGERFQGTTSKDYYVSKINNAGTVQSTEYTTTTDENSDSIYSVVAHSNTEIYQSVASKQGNLEIIKYNDSLAKQWTQEVKDSSIRGRKITTDTSGNIYSTGDVSGTIEGAAVIGQAAFGSNTAFVVKYNPSGTKLGSIQLGASSVDVLGRGVAVDGSGNVYTVGRTNGDLDGETKTGSIDMFLTNKLKP